MQQEEKIIQINIDLIIPNKYQPRKTFDESALKELSNSIKEYGILNPILVTKKEDKYEIIAGERRYRAAKMAGLTEVPVIVKTYEETKMAEIALIENLHRENLNPIEEAKSYQEIMRLSKVTQKDLGDKIGKSQAAIANKIRLLNLPPKIQESVSKKQISERHARSLMKVEDEEEQLELLNKVIDNKMTVKELDNLIEQQSITEQEIQDAINEIMKSLNIDNEKTEEDTETKKEEKESDNMNNGNFFPNFNNTMGNNNNVSLNTMNMQSMGNPAMAPVEETVMPTPTIPDFMANNQMPQQPMEEQQPMMNNNFLQDTPLFSQQQEVSMPNLEQPMMNPVMEQPQINQYQDAPLFDANFQNQAMQQVDIQSPMMNQPQELNMMSEQNMYMNTMDNNMVESVPVMSPVEESAVQAPINPDFMVNPGMNMEQESPIPSFEIPITSEVVQPPVVEMPTENVDKLSGLKNYLEQNGINYKQYSNETGNCIIIEM